MILKNKTQQPTRLRLRTYPYTYARVSAMRGKILKQDDYIRLLKMDISSITKSLEETEYKVSIDKLASKYSGVELIERALTDNLITTVAKLKLIAKPEVVALIEAYLNRWDIYNLKTILRAKLKQQKAEELIIPLGSLSLAELHELMGLAFTDILKRLEAKGYSVDASAFEKTKNLSSIENKLDKDFYHKTLAFAATIPREGAQFSRFLKIEIDVINIRNLLKLKRAPASYEQTMQYLIISGAHLDQKQLKSMAAAKNQDELLELLKASRYGALFDREASALDIELALDRHWLAAAQLYSHQNPLSVQTILAYLLAKDIEVRNLRALVRGKQLKLDELFIEQKLLTMVSV